MLVGRVLFRLGDLFLRADFYTRKRFASIHPAADKGSSRKSGFLYRRGSLTYINYRKPVKRAHSPNTAPQTGTAMPIRSLIAAGRLAQTTLARRAGPLSFISARSKKRARIKSSPARITSPTRKVPQPGLGKDANKRLATATAIPPKIKRTFRRANLPWPLRRW